MDEHELEGRLVVVTGASRGIGAAFAKRASAAGAQVAIVARTLDQGDEGTLVETAEACAAIGQPAIVVVADLSKSADRSRAITEVVEQAGRSVDVLVNNAAAATFEPILGLNHDARALMIELNVHAPTELSQLVIPGMVEKGEGWIVNLSTSSTPHPEYPPPAPSFMPLGYYAASKAMLERLTSGLAIELHGKGLRFNTVEPKNAVMTEGVRRELGDSLPKDMFESMEEMCAAILWLCHCPEVHSGKVEMSLDVIARESLEVHALDGGTYTPETD